MAGHMRDVLLLVRRRDRMPTVLIESYRLASHFHHRSDARSKPRDASGVAEWDAIAFGNAPPTSKRLAKEQGRVLGGRTPWEKQTVKRNGTVVKLVDDPAKVPVVKKIRRGAITAFPGAPSWSAWKSWGLRFPPTPSAD
jgi:hypothetical protein